MCDLFCFHSDRIVVRVFRRQEKLLHTRVFCLKFDNKRLECCNRMIPEFFNFARSGIFARCVQRRLKTVTDQSQYLLMKKTILLRFLNQASNNLYAALSFFVFSRPKYCKIWVERCYYVNETNPRPATNKLKDYFVWQSEKSVNFQTFVWTLLHLMLA